MGDPLIVSFRVNKKSATCGFPFCFTGEQPKVEIPPFYPDRASPYLSETEAKALFDQVESICKDTGAPLYPLILFPFALGIVPALAFGLDLDKAMELTIGAFVGIFVWELCTIGTFLMLAYKRKSIVTKLFEVWNKTEGGPKGLFFELGDIDGPSPDRFWRSIYPRNITIGCGDGDTTNYYDIFNDIEYAIFLFGL